MSTQKSINLGSHFVKKNDPQNENATTTKEGLMSKEDKSKLDGVESQANNYTHPSHPGYESGFYKITTNTLGHVIAVTPVTKSDITELGISASDHTHNYLSASDIKDNLTSTDTNKPLSAKQGKELKTLVDGKSASNHNHDGTYLKTHQSLSDIGGQVVIEEKSSANSGAFKTYQIKQGGVAVSGEIDIPKDFLVKSGSVKIAGATPTTAESNAGVNANEKYISLIVNTKDDNSNTGTELIIPATNLVDTYTAGTGLALTNQNQFKHSNSVTAQSTKAFKKIAYDSEGHITDTSNVEASDLPTHYHSEYLTEHQSLSNYIQKSSTNGLIKNNGTIDTNTYLTSHQDITGKLDKSQTSYKGKNVVVDSSSGNITFEDKPTLSSLSTQNEELSISDIQDLSTLAATHFTSSTTSMNLTGGVTGKTCKIYFQRIGRIVTFRLYGTYEGSTFAGTTFPYVKTVNPGNNVPEEYRPSRLGSGSNIDSEVIIHLSNYGTVDVAGMSVRISAGGTITLSCRDNTKTMLYYCTGTYITDYIPPNIAETNTQNENI